jgi:hypothetical protein
VPCRINGIGNPSRVIIPRHVYDEFGGFDVDNHFAAEMGLWLKIVTKYGVASVGEILCFERLHAGQQSFRYMGDGSGLAMVRQALEPSFAVSQDFWTVKQRGRLCRHGLSHFVRRALEAALAGDFTYLRVVHREFSRICPPGHWLWFHVWNAPLRLLSVRAARFLRRGKTWAKSRMGQK